MAQNKSFKLGGLGGTTKCCCAGCTTTVRAGGCNGVLNNVETLTIEIWDSTDTTLIASTTTSTGTFLATIPGAGTYHVHVTGSSRFDNYNQSQSLTCGGTKTVTLTPKSGYHCQCSAAVPVCAWPLADTLHASDSNSHTWTLSWTSASVGWEGSTVIGGVTYFFRYGGTGYCSVSQNARIVDGSSNGCVGGSWSITCPTAAPAAFNISITASSTGGSPPAGFCGTTVAVPWTITE
jgi:hypothetical protein